jgi:hypothetical protein
VVAQELLVGEHRLGGPLACWAEVECTQAFIFDRYDTLSGPELRDDLGVVSRERAFPAEGINITCKGRGEEFRKAPYLADTRLAALAHLSPNRLMNSLASAA